MCNTYIHITCYILTNKISNFKRKLHIQQNKRKIKSQFLKFAIPLYVSSLSPFNLTEFRKLIYVYNILYRLDIPTWYVYNRIYM